MNPLKNNSDIVMALAVFGLLAIMIVPLPTVVMDLLLALSISIGILIFLVTLYVRKPLDFSVFPIILLITTLFRLSLNVASTRLILLNGGDGARAAGRIIEAFGQFVIGGNYVVGFVVFTILVIINFVVITKGSGRIAEVAARFTLDAMPGKQMAVDAEFNSGAIDERTAKKKREDISREADFYGSMDGASKFIRGDAIAGIVIMFINIIAGIIIGVMQHDMTMAVSAQTYTILTIGDGLVGQIPALIISAAAGLLVTRVPDEEGTPLDRQFVDQIFGQPRVLGMVAAILFVFAFIPGLRLPFLLIGSIAGVIAYQMQGSEGATPERRDARGRIVEEDPEAPKTVIPDSGAQPEELLGLETIAFEVGYELVFMLDKTKGSEFLSRILRVRQQFAEDYGVVLPRVHFRDNGDLGSRSYRILLRGEIIGNGDIYPRKHLAINPGTARGEIRGIAAMDPAFGLPGFWISEGNVITAKSQGYMVVDAPTVLTTHFMELMRSHAYEIFDMTQLTDALERLSQRHIKLVEDLIPDPLPRRTLLKVMRNILEEGLSVRDTQTVLETLTDYAHRTQDPDVLTEFVRQGMRRHITHRYQDSRGIIHYIDLGPDVREVIARGLQLSESGSPKLLLDPTVIDTLRTRIERMAQKSTEEQQVLLCSQSLARGVLQRALRLSIPVVSSAELIPTSQLQRIGIVTLSRDFSITDPGVRTPTPLRRS